MDEEYESFREHELNEILIYCLSGVCNSDDNNILDDEDYDFEDKYEKDYSKLKPIIPYF
jgi:hypothetical protein